MAWLPAAAGVLALARQPAVAGTGAAGQPPGAAGQPGPASGPGLICVVNLSAVPVALPAHAGVLLASGPLDAGERLPPDTAAWLRAGAGR
jgi:alpha-glucosidase